MNMLSCEVVFRNYFVLLFSLLCEIENVGRLILGTKGSAPCSGPSADRLAGGPFTNQPFMVGPYFLRTKLYVLAILFSDSYGHY